MPSSPIVPAVLNPVSHRLPLLAATRGALEASFGQRQRRQLLALCVCVQFFDYYTLASSGSSGRTSCVYSFW